MEIPAMLQYSMATAVHNDDICWIVYTRRINTLWFNMHPLKAVKKCGFSMAINACRPFERQIGIPPCRAQHDAHQRHE